MKAPTAADALRLALPLLRDQLELLNFQIAGRPALEDQAAPEVAQLEQAIAAAELALAGVGAEAPLMLEAASG